MRQNQALADRLWRAESVVDILGKMDPERLPPDEGRALGECQVKAMEEWLSAYIDLKSASPAQ